MTNISTATRAELRETLRTMRAENLDLSKQLDLISADIIGMDPVTFQHNGGNTDPEQVVTIRKGRLMIRCLAKNAARTAAKLRSACRTPSTRQHVTPRIFPKFEPGMSTAQYVNSYNAFNREGANSVATLPYNLTSYLAPCALYEGGSLDFDAIEEPIDAPETSEPPEMVAIVSALTGATMATIPREKAEELAIMLGSTVQAARQVSELIASATTAAAIEHASEPTTEADHQDEATETATACELATVDAEPCAMATTCDASSASNTCSAPTHGHASSAAHQAPAPAQRATHDIHGQRIGQHVSGYSGNWCAVMFRDDCGRPAFEFEGSDGSREVWSFETGRERMAALQAMAREADDAADQDDCASDADQPPAEQAGIESIKDAIRMNEREMERVLKSKQKGSKESAYRIELIISELTDKLSAAMKASKSTTHPVEYQQPAPVPKTETGADTKAADEVPRAVATDFDHDHTASEAAAADATAGDATKHTDTTADEFERAAPQAFDMLAMIAAGMAPAEFVGLGIVYSGDMANPRGRGAITSMDANDWHHWTASVTLEDGRLFTCDPLSFKESIGNRFKTDFKRHGAPYLAELEAARLAAEASRKAAQQAAADEKDRQRRELPQQWPQLKAYDPAGKLSGCTLAAANIRILLKEKFPGVKFSVKTSKFSGGDDINVSWTDGPAQKDVEAIADLFSAGSFDGMEDIYNYRRSVFTELFGDAKYVFCNRHESAELIARALELEYPDASTRPSVEDWTQAKGAFDFRTVSHWTRQAMQKRLDELGGNYST